MNSQELLKVSDGLTWLSDRLKDLPESHNDAVAARSVCMLANFVVAELAFHLSQGTDPYDALVRAAKGTMNHPEVRASVMRRLLELG